MKTSRSRRNLSESYDEEENFRKLKSGWQKTLEFAKRNYPVFLIGVLFTAATTFSILSYKQRKGKETLFISKADILGEKAGSFSATATISAKIDELSLVSSVSSTKPATKSGPVSSKSGFLININTADASTLDQLTGISPATAKNIVQFRQTHGPFKDIRELTKVSGIKEKRFAAIKGLVTVGE